MRAAFSSPLIHRLSLEFPIQSNPSPYTKRITHHNVRSKKRARKGGARGGKTGFATLSAFPLVPAHAKMVPLKGKVPASHASPGKGITCVSSIPPGKGITCVSSIPPERENILRKVIRLRFHQGTAGSELPEDNDPPEVHQTLRKYSDRKLPYRFLYKAPARSVPDTM